MTPLSEQELKDRPLTVEELMEFLRVGRNTALKLLSEGKIKAVKVGNQWRITRQAIDDYLNGNNNQ